MQVMLKWYDMSVQNVRDNKTSKFKYQSCYSCMYHDRDISKCKENNIHDSDCWTNVFYLHIYIICVCDCFCTLNYCVYILCVLIEKVHY